MPYSWTLTSILAGSLFLVAAGANGVAVEGRPFLSESGAPAVVAGKIVAEPGVSPATSTFALNRLVRNCDQILTAGTTPAIDVARFAEVTAACRTRMDAVLTLVPDWSYGWLVRAKVAERQADFAAMAEALTRSRDTAPAQYFLAAGRFLIAMRHQDALPASLGPVVDEDIRLLAQSASGTRLLARRYATDAAFRERVTGIVETLDPVRQRSFLSQVRKAAQEG